MQKEDFNFLGRINSGWKLLQAMYVSNVMIKLTQFGQVQVKVIADMFFDTQKFSENF